MAEDAEDARGKALITILSRDKEEKNVREAWRTLAKKPELSWEEMLPENLDEWALQKLTYNADPKIQDDPGQEIRIQEPASRSGQVLRALMIPLKMFPGKDVPIKEEPQPPIFTCGRANEEGKEACQTWKRVGEEYKYTNKVKCCGWEPKMYWPSGEDGLQIHLQERDIQHLNQQRLFEVEREVRVEAKSLPKSFRASDACNSSILANLSDEANRALLRTDTVQAVIAIAWEQFRLVTALDIFLNLTVVILLTFCSVENRLGAKPLSLYGLLLAIHIIKTLEEVAQYAMEFKRIEHKTFYRKLLELVFDPENIADVGFFVVGWFALVRRIEKEPSSDFWMAMFCGWSWMKLLYSLRGEEWIGPRMLPIFSALKDTLSFFFVVAIAVAAASHAYYDLHLRMDAVNDTGPWFEAYAAVLHTARLGIFGDFDLHEFEGVDPIFVVQNDSSLEPGSLAPEDPSPSLNYPAAHILFYMIGIGVTVLLMNLLVGILSTDFDYHEQQALELFCSTRVKMMKEIKYRITCQVVLSSWELWLKLASIQPQMQRDMELIQGKCINNFLGISAFPLKWVLGGATYELLVQGPVKVFAKEKGILPNCLALLLTPVIFAFTLLIFIILWLSSWVIRAEALRHTFRQGLGVRAEEPNPNKNEKGETSWFAGQCGVVLFACKDDGWNGSRSGFEELGRRVDEAKQEVKQGLGAETETLRTELREVKALLNDLAARPMAPMAGGSPSSGLQQHLASLELRLDGLSGQMEETKTRVLYACAMLDDVRRVLGDLSTRPTLIEKPLHAAHPVHPPFANVQPGPSQWHLPGVPHRGPPQVEPDYHDQVDIHIMRPQLTHLR